MGDRPRPVNSIFQESWWLDAVAPGQWGHVEVRAGDHLQAWMPYVLKHGPLGLVRCSMPSLTQTLGPYVVDTGAKYVKALGRETKLVGELIEQLPECDYLAQNLHHSVQNTLPFRWAGCTVTVNYTYVLPDLTDEEALWRGMGERTRRNIRKARKQVTVRQTDDLEAFLHLNRLTYDRQDMEVPFDEVVARRIDAACAARDRRRIFLAEDAEGRLHAGLYLVYNELSAYYLMGGADPELRASEAGSLLMWEAIRFAAGVSARFDFEGSMMRKVEPFVRSFGALQTPYYHVRRLSRRGKVAWAARDLYRALRA